MSDKILLVDIDKCIGCYACEIACKEEHNLAVASRWCRVAKVGPRAAGGELYLDIAPAMCLHCDDPACAYFCTAGAIKKRPDGIVVIDKNACNGCKLCLYGCPYGAIHFNEATKKAEKCDLCADRADDAQPPSCVQHCIGGALEMVSPAELEDITGGAHLVKLGKVCYISRRWKLQAMAG